MDEKEKKLNIEDYENIIDNMYQEKMNNRIEKNGEMTFIHIGEKVEFTKLEEASVIILREEIRLKKLVEEQQKEIEQLANGIRVLGTNPDITTEEIIKEFTEKPITEEYMEEFKNSYISKDEVLKAIGYEENDEEYDRLKQDDEKLLAILDTMYSEFCRLEDIEDKKVSVAVNFIEEKRDKYWQNKIKDKINYYDDKLIELAEKEHNWNKMNEVQQMEHQLLKNRYTNYHNVLSELLEEN